MESSEPANPDERHSSETHLKAARTFYQISTELPRHEEAMRFIARATYHATMALVEGLKEDH